MTEIEDHGGCDCSASLAGNSGPHHYTCPLGPKSKNKDGWTGEKCPTCKGKGEVDTPHSHATCGGCGGTGELYISALDERDNGEDLS